MTASIQETSIVVTVGPADVTGSVEGSFAERPSDVHVQLRRDLLENRAALAPVSGPVRAAHAARFPDAAGGDIHESLRRQGVAVLQLDDVISSGQLLALGSLLGTPMPESDPAVVPNVEHGVILHLVREHGYTDDDALQPFAANPLSLHSESSARPAAEQPRYIVLYCREPGDEMAAAQTVLVPMASVARRLTSTELGSLSRTRYRRHRGSPCIARIFDGRCVFSFRDFLGQRLDWTYTGQDRTLDEIEGCLRALLAAMYRPDGAAWVRWGAGMIVVIDNTFFFHGRTAAALPAPARARHLMRLRVVAAT